MTGLEWVLILHNNAAYCLAVVILLSLLIQRRWVWYLVGFLLTTASGLYWTLTGRSHLTMPAAVLLLTLLFSLRRRKTLPAVFSRCLTAVFLSWCLIMPLSCAVMIAAPRWHNGLGCNLLSGGALILYACLLRWVPSLAGRVRALRLGRYVILLELLVLTFFTLLLPLYFPVFQVESKRQVGVFTLAFLIFLAFAAYLIGRMGRAEGRRQQLEGRIRQQQSFRQQTQRQFDTVIALRHFYSRLFQGMAPLIREGDLAGVEAYFEQHIAPIHREQVRERPALQQVENQVIRNLLEALVAQADSLEGIALELAVEGPVAIPKDLEADVFEILCNLADNALKELEGQRSGLLRILLQWDGAVTTLTVANTTKGPLPVESLYRKGARGAELEGHGLNRVREIVYRCPRMEHLTHKNGRYGEREILVQTIIIGEQAAPQA